LIIIAPVFSAPNAREVAADMSPLPSIAPRARKFRREKLGELESFDMVISYVDAGRVE
jgi:hypothetical protein